MIAALALAAPPAVAETTYGLVIGIDAYTYVTDLHGAVNDARDIADALEGLGAEVTLLLDGHATRAAILGAWDQILDEAGPGDRLIVSFAGHGSNEPEQSVGSELDGRDENFLLAGFAPYGAAAAERIRDDEIADFLARSAELDVIFVADACHAGTVTRNVDPVLGYRYVEADGIASDPLPPPPPPSNATEGRDHVALFLAAVDETQRVPEVLIDGVPRGALSYAFASGLRGEADRNGDGLLTKGELESHVRRIVREASDGIQLPQSQPAGQETRALLELGDRDVAPEPAVPAQAPPPLTALSFEALPPLTVSGAPWDGITDVSLVAHGALRLDGTDLFSSMGDTVARVTSDRLLQDVVDTQRVVAALRAIAEPPLAVEFAEGDRVYAAREHLHIRITGRAEAYLTLVNVAADGTISYLYPVPQLGDPDQLRASETLDLPVEVSAPFGSDHVIAIETADVATGLRAALQDLSGTRNMAALWNVLRTSDARFAIFPFFTAERQS